MSDVIDLIEHDHREVEKLFGEYESSNSRTVAAKICDELAKHTAAEESEVYPVIEREVNGGKKLADEGEHEHKEARQLIGRIRNTTDQDHLEELMNELKQAVEHHVKEEEPEMLPKARQELPATERNEMGEKFEGAKEAAG